MLENQTNTSTLTTPDGTVKRSERKSETIVTIEKTDLAPTLFEVPRGLKRVTRINPNPPRV